MSLTVWAMAEAAFNIMEGVFHTLYSPFIHLAIHVFIRVIDCSGSSCQALPA